MGAVTLIQGSFLDSSTVFEWMQNADIIFINNGSWNYRTSHPIWTQLCS